MELPEIDEIEFSPLAWKEWMLRGDRSLFGSKRKVFEFLTEKKDEGYFENFIGIENSIENDHIRKLLNGYAIHDLLDCTKAIEFERFKMWRLFEDIVAEIFREIVKEKIECSVVYVDKWPGFRGLDYIITNGESEIGWKVGIQCKKYIGTRIPYCRVNDYSSYSRGPSAASLYDRGIELKQKYSERRKILLISFEAFRRNKNQEKKFKNLKETWDSVIVFDDNKSDASPYTYKIKFDNINQILKWC
jgi:hypothetical protein